VRVGPIHTSPSPGGSPAGGWGVGGGGPVPRQKASKPLGLAGAGGFYAGPPGQLVRLVRPGWPPVGGLGVGGCWGIRGMDKSLGRERGLSLLRGAGCGGRAPGQLEKSC
jgi:hypothetical protein